MKMRKALSFVLVLALVLGSFSMVFATEGVKQGTDLSDISGNANYDAIVANSDLGIITGYTDGSFKPANAVNRAEFAAMITRMMGVPDSALAGYSSTNFTDMAGYGWANSYVGFCAAKGIVNGYGNGTFGPGNTITVNEAVTMVLRAVGYVSNSNELVGTWPSNYVTLGKRLGLYDDVASTTTIDRANAAQVIYNALTCIVVAVNADGDTKDAYTTGSGDNYYAKNVLEVYLDCTLYGDEEDLDKDGFGVYPYEAAQDSVINTMAYVGAYVKAFANDDGDVVAIAESKSTFLKGKYDVDDEEFKVGDTVYTLTEKNLEKAKAAFVNMKDITPVDSDKKAAVDAATVDKDAAGTDSLFDGYATKTGSVTLAVDMSGKTIKEVYSIHKWVATDAFFYEKDMLEDDNLYGYDFDLDNDNAIDNGKFQLNGVKALSDIAEDNIVEVFTVGNSDNGDIARVDVGTKTVEGKITMVDDGDYTIGGEVYSAASVLAANEKDSLPTDSGDTGTAYLSFSGDIVGWELEDASSDNYAVVSGEYDKNGRDYTIMLVDKTGTEKEYVIKDAVDGTDSGPNYSDETGGTFADASDLNVGDLVTFSLDKNGKIDELNAVAQFNTGAAGITNKQVNKNRTLFDNKTLDSGVVVFSYDANTVAASDFDVIALKDLEAEKDFSDAAGAFYYAKDGKIKAMLVPDKYTGADSIYAVINKVKAATNDDDDDVLYVEGIANGEKFKKYTDDPKYGAFDKDFDVSANRTTVYELTLNAGGIITDVEAVDESGTGDLEAPATGLVADKSGNYLIQVGSTWCTLDPNVKVYKYDINEGEFTTAKVGDIYKASGNKAASNVKVWQADDDSEVYDIVVIYDNLTKVTYGVSDVSVNATADTGTMTITFNKAVEDFDTAAAIAITDAADADATNIVVTKVGSDPTSKVWTVTFDLGTEVDAGASVALTVHIDAFGDYNVTTADITKTVEAV